MGNFTTAVIDDSGNVVPLPDGGKLVDSGNNQLVNTNQATTRVRVATTADVADLATGAPDTVNGVALNANDRILVKDQADPTENGIYIAQTVGTGSNGTWVRATDMDEDAEISALIIVQVVEGGPSQADTLWMLDSTGGLVIGTSDINFVKVSGNRRQKTYGRPFYLNGRDQLTDAEIGIITPLYPGYIVGASIVLDDPRTAGTIDVSLEKGGVDLGAAVNLQINASETKIDFATQAYGTTGYDVAAGDEIAIQVTTSSFAPLTATGFIEVTIESEA